MYRRAIKDVGKQDMLHMKAEAIDTFRQIWSKHGEGWFTEVVDYSPIPGCKSVFAYYGSSTYDTVEMSKVLDYLKDEMQNMDLPIPVSKEEEARLMSAWGRAYYRQQKNATSAEGKPASNDTTSSQE